MTWSDVVEIARALVEQHPRVEPLRVRSADLERWVRELPGFDDRGAGKSEAALQAIQMAWLDEVDG